MHRLLLVSTLTLVACGGASHQAIPVGPAETSAPQPLATAEQVAGDTDLGREAPVSTAAPMLLPTEQVVPPGDGGLGLECRRCVDFLAQVAIQSGLPPPNAFTAFVLAAPSPYSGSCMLYTRESYQAALNPPIYAPYGTTISASAECNCACANVGTIQGLVPGI
jgi:hypothetical protein